MDGARHRRGQSRRVERFRRTTCAALLTLGTLVSGCGGDGSSAPPVSVLDDDRITVGSFDFTESVVLAEVYSQGLEAQGYDVQRAFSLGPREFVGPALTAGLLELVPEYAGTAAEFYSLGRAEPSEDVTTTHAELVRAVDGSDVVALAAAPAEDANTFVVTRGTANQHNLEKISDLQAVAPTLAFGGPPECPTRRLCLAGLIDTYGLKFGRIVTLDAGGTLTQQALKEGVVDVALMFTTDPAIANLGLVELTDDRGLQPAESITPLVRSEVAEKWGPDVVSTIDDISARLTTAAVRDLNGAAAPAGTDVAAVASAWWSEVNS